jgi:dynein heavy chain
MDTVSVAISTLAKYLVNMEVYYYLKRDVVPKEQALKESEEKLAFFEEKLDTKKRALKEITDMVAELKKSLDSSVKQAESLKADQEKAKVQLLRAQKLLNGLADESERWKQSEIDLTNDLNNLVGDYLLSSAILAYLGPFTATYRKDIIAKWKAMIIKSKLPFGQSFSLEKAAV